MYVHISIRSAPCLRIRNICHFFDTWLEKLYYTYTIANRIESNGMESHRNASAWIGLDSNGLNSMDGIVFWIFMRERFFTDFRFKDMGRRSQVAGRRTSENREVGRDRGAAGANHISARWQLRVRTRLFPAFDNGYCLP